MEQSSIVDMAGWRSLVTQMGLLVIGALSFAILFSFGGQLIVAPALLPVQWIVARYTDGWVSRVFSVLGSVLLAEVLYLGFRAVLGDNALGTVEAAAIAVAAAVVFYRTSRDGK